jgi:hypothetical protein
MTRNKRDLSMMDDWSYLGILELNFKVTMHIVTNQCML